MKLRVLAGCMLLICTVPVALAHHSRAAFALDSERGFEGKLLELGWQNPHAYLVVMVREEDGSEQRWTFEGHSISGLVRLGWRRDSFVIGERVRVQANPARDTDQPFALLQSITSTDGTTLYAFKKPRNATSSPTKPLAPSTDFSGTWKPVRTLRSALLGGFTPPESWPYTERARQEISAFQIADDPALDCVDTGLPRMIKWPYSQRWTVTENHIEIVTDQSSRRRKIALGAVSGALHSTPNPAGHSTGKLHSERELSIHSNNFPAQKWGLARGVSSSARKSVQETWRLSNDGYGLTVSFLVCDPDYLHAAVEQTAEFELVQDYAFNSVPCDPATARRHLQFE